MNLEFKFFKTAMPKSRKADYQLGCLDSSVYIDFNRTVENRILLQRISFDGYGCCNLDEQANHLNTEDSQKFIEELKNEELNQEIITKLVKEAIKLNQKHIWIDAIEEYGFYEK